MATEKCTCGNPEYGFECVCDHVKKHPGDIEYTCEFHGLYSAQIGICNRCEKDDDTVPCVADIDNDDAYDEYDDELLRDIEEDDPYGDDDETDLLDEFQ